MVLDWKIKAFDELTTRELYAIVKSRFEVFVMEQEITCENDFDDKDLLTQHIFLEEDGEVVAYARILPKGLAYETASIGRVLVLQKARRRGLGKEMMEEAVRYITSVWKDTEVTLSAQAYIVPLYESVGFKQVSDIYDEAGIPHIKMKYTVEV
ncbi:MAG: GNAT family N-acetyltransferase [Cellulosilyticaceae bacterium]